MNTTPEELLPTVVATAKSICADQPDMSEPNSLGDLDSFSFVQVILELENITGKKLLERLEHFKGDTFEDLAAFIAECGTDPVAPEASTTA